MHRGKQESGEEAHPIRTLVQVRLQVLDPALLDPQADGGQCVSCSAVGEAGVSGQGKGAHAS